MTNPNPKNEIVDSLKAAGASAFGVAKEFTERFREDRAHSASASSFTTAESAETTETGAGKESIIDKVTAVAKDLGGSAKRAAEATSQTPEFAEAKEKIGVAFNSTRDGVSEAYDNAKAMRAAKKGEATPAADSQPENKGDIIDGEVISTEDN